MPKVKPIFNRTVLLWAIKTMHHTMCPQSELVSRCFKPSQPQRIISELRETFVKGYIVERTNKAEIRPEEQSGKAESCRENLWNEIQLNEQ